MTDIADKKSNLPAKKRGGARPNSGGARPGSGRKPGATNKRTVEMLETARANGIMPLDYLLSIMRNSKQEEDVRMDAAKAAAPYLHPKLSSVEMNAKVTTHEAGLDDLA